MSPVLRPCRRTVPPLVGLLAIVGLAAPAAGIPAAANSAGRQPESGFVDVAWHAGEDGPVQFSGAHTVTGNRVAVDASGNVLATGQFSGVADFDPGPSVLELASAGDTDAYLVKLDSSGGLVWGARLGAVGADEGWGLATDTDGNVHLTGYFTGSADVDPGDNVVTLTSAGDNDGFLVTLAPDGSFVRAAQFGGPGKDWVRSIALDASDNVYISGFFENTVDFDPGAGTHNLTSTGGRDGFVVKLDPTGVFLWAIKIGNSHATLHDEAVNLTVDGDGNVLLTGNFFQAADFDPGLGTFELTSNAGSSDAFVLKLDTDGNFVWAGALGGPSSDEGRDIAVDATGNVYVGGWFRGTGDFDPGPGTLEFTCSSGVPANANGFLVALDPGGSLIWARHLASDTNLGINEIDGDVDGSGLLSATGWFSGTADFDPGLDTFDMTASGSNDGFLWLLDGAGNFVDATTVSGPGNDNGRAVAFGSDGDAYWTGFFEQTADFDPGTPLVELTSYGNEDAFVALQPVSALPRVYDVSMHVIFGPDGSNVLAVGWPEGEQLHLTIERADEFGNPQIVFQKDAVVDQPDDQGNISQAWFDPNFPIERRDIVTISGGGYTTTHQVTEITFDAVDADDDVVSGSGAWHDPVCVDIWRWPDDPATACASPDELGNWAIDFTGIYSLDTDSVMGVFDRDEGGATQVDWRVPLEPQISVWMGPRPDGSGQMVDGENWPEGVDITLTIDDPLTEEQPDYTSTPAAPNGNGNVQFLTLEHGFVIEPGFTVTMSDGTTTRSHVVTKVIAVETDAEADLVHGFAEPGSLVTVGIWGPFPYREVYAGADLDDEVEDGLGPWTADFSVPQEDQPAIDLVENPGCPNSAPAPCAPFMGEAWQADDDGDQTRSRWWVPDRPFDFFDGGDLLISQSSGSLWAYNPSSSELTEYALPFDDNFDIQYLDPGTLFIAAQDRGVMGLDLTTGAKFVVVNDERLQAIGLAIDHENERMFISDEDSGVWLYDWTNGDWGNGTLSLLVAGSADALAYDRDWADEPNPDIVHGLVYYANEGTPIYRFDPDAPDPTGTVELFVDNPDGRAFNGMVFNRYLDLTVAAGDAVRVGGGDGDLVADITIPNARSIEDVAVVPLDDPTTSRSDLWVIDSGFVDGEFGADPALYYVLDNGGFTNPVVTTVIRGAPLGDVVDILVAQPLPEPPTPIVQAYVTEEFFRGEGFTPSSSVTVSLYDTDGTTPLIDHEPIGTDGDGTFWYGDPGTEQGLLPGMVLEVTDDASGITKVLQLVDVRFDSFDPDTGVVAGFAADRPLAGEIRLHLRDQDGNAMDDGTGHPIALFPGTASWSFDLNDHAALHPEYPDHFPDGLQEARVEVPDEDGDGTFGQLPQVRASAQFGYVNADHFDSDPFVRVDVYRDGGATPVWSSGSVDTSLRGEFHVDSEVGLQPGDEVVVSGLTTLVQKHLVLSDITVDEFDIDNDRIGGTAPPLARVEVNVGNGWCGSGMQVVADDSGNWLADFATQPGCDTEWFDITDDMGTQAMLLDPDMDATVAEWFVPESPWFRVNPGSELILGWNWFDGPVTVTIDGNDDPSDDVLFTTDVGWIGGDGYFEVHLEGVFDLVAGQFVTVTNGIDTKVHQVTNLTVTAIDPDADTVSGITGAGAQVHIEINGVLQRRAVEHLVFNLSAEGSWNQYPEFRRAVAYAIDREYIALQVGAGPAIDSYMDAWLPYLSQGAWSQYSHDPDAARALIGALCAELEHDCDASPPHAVLTTTDAARRQQIAALLGQMLDAVGIELEIVHQSAQEYFGQTVPNGDFEVGEWAWGSPANFDGVLEFLRQIDPEQRWGDNLYRYGTPGSATEGTDAALRLAELIGLLHETGDVTLLEAYLMEAEQILADEVAFIPLYVGSDSFDTEYAPGVTTRADESGNWTADFAGIFDIHPGADGWASEPDEDGDETQVEWRLPGDPEFVVTATHDWVEGFDFEGDTITVTFDGNDDPLDGVLHQETFGVEPWSYGWLHRIDGFDIQAGQFVTVTDGITIKTTAVSPVEITLVDRAGWELSGIADPANEIVMFGVHPEFVHPEYGPTGAIGVVPLYPDADGNWTLNLDPYVDPNNRPDEIPDGAFFGGWQRDDDGDRTVMLWDPAVVDGRVLADGEPVAGAEVYFAGTVGTRQTCTDEDGYFEIGASVVLSLNQPGLAATGRAANSETACSNPDYLDAHGKPLLVGLQFGPFDLQDGYEYIEFDVQVAAATQPVFVDRFTSDPSQCPEGRWVCWLPQNAMMVQAFDLNDADFRTQFGSMPTADQYDAIWNAGTEGLAVAVEFTGAYLLSPDGTVELRYPTASDHLVMIRYFDAELLDYVYLAQISPAAALVDRGDGVLIGPQLSFRLWDEINEPDQQAQAALELILGLNSTDQHITKAIEEIQHALDPAYWVDDHTLTADGDEVFKSLSKAVKELAKAEEPLPEVETAVAALVDAARTLAQIEVGLALDLYPDLADQYRKSVDKAVEELQKGTEQEGSAKYEKAIDHYGKAWSKAYDARAG